jgi:hypothetical protein
MLRIFNKCNNIAKSGRLNVCSYDLQGDFHVFALWNSSVEMLPYTQSGFQKYNLPFMTRKLMEISGKYTGICIMHTASLLVFRG